MKKDHKITGHHIEVFCVELFNCLRMEISKLSVIVHGRQRKQQNTSIWFVVSEWDGMQTEWFNHFP